MRSRSAFEFTQKSALASSAAKDQKNKTDIFLSAFGVVKLYCP